MKPTQTQPSGPGVLMDLSRAFMKSQVLFSGVELGIFDALAKGPATPAAVAKKLKLNARGTDRLMHALASLELLEKKGEAFRLAPIARAHLVSGAPGSMANILMHSANLQGTWAQLGEVVRSGKPVPRPPAPDKNKLRNFILGMDDLAAPMARTLAARLDLKNVRQVIDIGGGPGTYLFTVLRAAPKAEGAVFDLPHVIPITIEQIEKNGLKRRAGTIQGDFLRDDLGTGFDLAILSNVLHSNSPAECRMLLRKSYRALNPGGCAAVTEFILRRDRTGPPSGALFAINMLVGTPGGSAYSREEILGWMRAAGFRDFKTVPLAPHAESVIGRKPRAARRK